MPGVAGLSATEITTGMPQGATSTSKSFIPNNPEDNPCGSETSSGSKEGIDIPVSKETPDDSSSIPQVMSFDDVSSIVLDKSEGHSSQRCVP